MKTLLNIDNGKKVKILKISGVKELDNIFSVWVFI